MGWRGIILTGTSAAGKTTLSALLRERQRSFEQVKAVTTRSARSDDEPGSYIHLAEEEFDRLGGDLVIWAGYRDRRYGITRRHIADVEDRKRVPVLLITAQSLAEYLERAKGSASSEFLTVFVDAPDEVLDARLAGRGGSAEQEKVARQRAEDRRYREAAAHILVNVDIERSLQQLLEWWQRGSAPGDVTA
jgi:guanylate kinase